MLDKMKQTIDYQSHKFAVSQAIFCPVCDNVLDIKTATSITVYKDNNPVYTKVFCSKHLQPDYKQAQQTLCTKNGLRAELYHGKTKKLEIIE